MARRKKRNLPTLKGLTDKQQKFVDEYLVDLNASQAAMRAGYSKKSAAKQSVALMAIPGIKEAIDAAKTARMLRMHVTQDMVLRELCILGFSSVDNYVIDDGDLRTADDVDSVMMRAVSSIKRRITTTKDGDTYTDVEYRLWNKPDALKMIAAHLGICTEKKDVTVHGSLYELIEAAEDEEQEDK